MMTPLLPMMVVAVILMIPIMLGVEGTAGEHLSSSSKSHLMRPTRYLLYSVNAGEGFNLARDVYTRAVQLYQSLDHSAVKWILVLPPFRSPHWPPQYPPLQWSQAFDLQQLEQAVHEVMTFDRYLEQVRPRSPQIDHIYHLQLPTLPPDGIFKQTIMEAETCNFGSYPGNEYHQNQGKWTGSFFGYGSAVSSRQLTCYEMLGPASLLANLVNSFQGQTLMLARLETAFTLSYQQKLYWDIRRSMVFMDRIKTTSQSFIDQRLHGPFLALHLRRADFLFVRRNDIPALTDTTKQISVLLRHYQLKHVFIATDARSTDAEFTTFLESLSPAPVMYTGTDNLHPAQLALIDQWICVQAAVFVGTPGSTFTSRIQEERDILGRAESTSHLLLEHAKPGPQPFSLESKAKWPIVR
eukprot:m.103752 g.103752  ORF g.103752 m.103752 type:complete len:410 (-) comp15055_c2_seq1:1794-3023(-)